jgi:galactonate dehydratase
MANEPRSEGLNRREFVESAGLVAAGGILLAGAAGAAEPGANVEDKGSAVRITALKATPVGPKAFVKIETSMKVTGWGEITGLEPKVASALAESLFELLDGENPTRVEHLWQKLYRAHRDMRGGPFMVHTISAIDMALWDITGKLYGVPVYRLLGGPTREKVRMYPTAKATKLGTGGPHPFSGNPSDINGLVKTVEDTRKRLGPDGTIMFDAHCAVPPPMLIQLAAAIQPYDILFLEEPAVPGNIEVFKRLKQHVKIPMAAGERDRTIWEMIAYLHNRCLDILQPDVGHTGGISQVKKIATLAEAYHVPLAPHNTCSELGLTASLHVAASIPLFLIHETAPQNLAWGEQFLRKPWTVDKDGYASIPQGPGLGVEVDEQKMAQVAADPKQKFVWPQVRLKDGSVADY